MSTSPSTRWPLVICALVIGVGLGAAAVWFSDRESVDAQTGANNDAETTTATAETRDLRSFEEWAGVLQAGTAANVSASVRGTVTRNADLGDRIELGDVIAEIDGNPVVALYGSVPQFRELEANADDGADIQQLEESLIALGYDPDGTVTVDENYTVYTGLMVERWETDLGLESPDSIVAAGQVAFIAGPSEVVSRTAVASAITPGQSLLSTVTLAESGFLTLPIGVDAIGSLLERDSVLTNDIVLAQIMIGESTLPLRGVEGEINAESTDAVEVEIVAGAVITDVLLSDTGSVEVGRPTHLWEAAQGSIELEVDVDQTSTFPVGRAVEVVLPDGQIVAAQVESVDDVARTVQVGQDSTTVVDVTVQPLDPLVTLFTSGPVTIQVEDEAILGATMVPVRALVALAEGGHAIEIDGQGLVAVDLGAFDEGWVEITNGAIDPGDVLVVPK